MRTGLLDRGARHTVYVQNREEKRDSGGRRHWELVGPRIPHRCSFQPARDWSSAEENVRVGLQVLDMGVILSREWAGDVNSLVYWEGSEYEMVGAPQLFSMSERTRHWRATVRRKGADPEA